MPDHRLAPLLLVIAVALGTASVVARGPLPGDLPLLRATQALLGDDPGWARAVTALAKFPLAWLSLVVAIVLAGWMGGKVRAALPVVAFAVAHLLDQGLRLFVQVPRPFVDAGLGSSSLPSTFGLVWGALVTAVVLAAPARHRIAAATLGILALLIGLLARVTLAGHWLSQMLASLALAAAATRLLAGVTDRR